MNNTTIKVSKSTVERLHRVGGELAKKKGKRITLEDAILYLLEKIEETSLDAENIDTKVERDRKAILSLMEKKFYGIHPEDFKEYNFEDIGG